MILQTYWVILLEKYIKTYIKKTTNVSAENQRSNVAYKILFLTNEHNNKKNKKIAHLHQSKPPMKLYSPNKSELNEYCMGYIPTK